MSIRLGLIILLLGLINNIIGQNLVINEFMSSNSKTLYDWEGDTPDWLEIYNAGSDDINLEGFYLSDNLEELILWSFPEITIPSKSFIVVYASKKDTIVENEIHTNFKISQDGEDLILSSPQAIPIHHIQPVFVPQDITFSCIPDGNKENMNESFPTPLSANQISYAVQSSHISGFYPDEILLELNSPNSEAEIRYTLNGSEPEITSAKYEAGIVLDSVNHQLGDISQIPTTPLEGPHPLPTFVWNHPGEIEKAHVVRYALFENGLKVTQTYTKTFFIGEHLFQKYDIPVFSLVTDSLNLFQYDTGIYIPGAKFEEVGWQWYPYGNYRERGRDWERNVHISLFEEDRQLIFETNSGMRVRGAGSSCNPQKSLGIYFRSEYGLNKVEHKIYDDSDVDEFKRIVLRSSGNDMLNTHFRDAVLTELLKPLDLELQNSRPSIVFINGEYWGIHNIREKYDQHYFKYHFNIPEDEINILGIAIAAEEGEELNYREVHNYVTDNDMSTEESYHYIAERVDIANMIDFLIAEIYYANYDWPCNNYRKWRTDADDSKWRFLIYDLDLSFGFRDDSQWNHESLVHAFFNGDDWPNCGVSNHLFRGMIENERFVDEFVERFEWHLKNTFESSHVVSKIDEFQSIYEPYIVEHIDRWGYPNSYDKWIEEIEVMKEFALKRPCYMKEHLMEYFQLENFDFDCDSLNNNLPSFTPDDFKLYPNPTSHQEFSVRSKIPGAYDFEYNVFSSDGKFITNGILKGLSTRINIGRLVPGVYVVEVFNTDCRFRYKLIKTN